MSVESFRKSLNAEARREEIHQSFDRLDEQVQMLLTAVAAVAKDHKVLQRSVSRVIWADDLLDSRQQDEPRRTSRTIRRSHPELETSTEGMQDLKIGESAYLIHNASQMERLHETLFHIVGGKGDRPRIST